MHPQLMLASMLHWQFHHLFCHKVCYGLQDIVGERGNIIPTFSLRSCANFQSYLDGKCMDISRGLREILQRLESLRFIQFYADSPHLSSSSIHPVFGAISSCGILGEKVQQALHHQNIWEKLQKIQWNLVA